MTQLYFSSRETAKKLARRSQKGELTRVRQGIYIDTHDPDLITRTLDSKWADIACYLFGEPVATARTAVELRPTTGRLYFVSGDLAGRRTIRVEHLRFDIGPGVVDTGVEPVTPTLKRSNPARQCLENLASSRGKADSKKTLGRAWVESELVKMMTRGGEARLNALRDEARTLAPLLGLEKEFTLLNKMISALLNTHPGTGILQTRLGMAQAKGEPFDPVRVDRLQDLAAYLRSADLAGNSYTYNKSSWRNLSFFESYFSNFIEGTEFRIEEAEEIIFQGKTIYQRHEDSHDVLAHMEITSDMAEMHKVPSTPSELIDILKTRHGVLLAERKNKRPGQFKEKPNKAGGTDFVLPELVEGTLVQGFQLYELLPVGMPRAIFMHFLVSECHPFDDGNGRMSRIMMNAELVAQDQYKIMVPTVHRDSYLNGLRKATRESRFRTMVKVLHQLQCYTASVQWDEFGEAKQQLKAHAADKEPDEGVPIFNKVISRFGDHYPAD